MEMAINPSPPFTFFAWFFKSESPVEYLLSPRQPFVVRSDWQLLYSGGG